MAEGETETGEGMLAVHHSPLVKREVEHHDIQVGPGLGGQIGSISADNPAPLLPLSPNTHRPVYSNCRNNVRPMGV